MADILDGKLIAKEIQEELQNEVTSLQAAGIKPRLTVILVGEDPASASYVRSKARLADKLGISSDIYHLPEDAAEAQVMAKIEQLNADPQVDAILVQLPLPPQMDANRVLAAVAPEKDVDGFHPYNIGRYASGLAPVWPCTPAGIGAILARSGIRVAGRTAVVVGRSQIVGWPTAQLLLAQNATVIQCHRQTEDLPRFTRQADILVVAAGQAGLIQADDVKAGVVVIDVGMNRVDGRLVGDVDFAGVAEKASAITPVPGGVGPLTVTMLMHNTLRLAKLRRWEER